MLGSGARRPNPRISVKNAVFAKIVVGFDKAEFTIHQDLLTHHSPFFRAALTGKFEESETKEVVLADTKPEIVEFFVHWLYYGRFPEDRDDAALVDLWTCDDEKGSRKKTRNLIRLYIFCDKYDVPQLRHTVMDELYSVMTFRAGRLPDPSITSEAFEKLPDESGMCPVRY
ncbi:hypothetical protein IAQ61_000461 [Plenodomus lingam]|uniref:BTB domain-containing protein n=1 Tax=Leptosphaeria maculans (strain JN3 / isolate v23.1.3 / race Av1-4-5-6-7-8) TaxID=985895 RepID=E5R507_LEPMJ|nr:hypothetical protein LEMA_P049860.1 [Plenodomus lingam JN3]KAH9881733.1 hypothetical protein IAQ61_000461 [Plenodomus lingam]CBX92280.1 hypothetical protein LEMA_P049860.1 [Plenodomus lingam JN3]